MSVVPGAAGTSTSVESLFLPSLTHLAEALEVDDKDVGQGPEAQLHHPLLQGLAVGHRHASSLGQLEGKPLRTVSPPTDGPCTPPVYSRGADPQGGPVPPWCRTGNTRPGCSCAAGGPAVAATPCSRPPCTRFLLGVPQQATGGAERPVGVSPPHTPQLGSLLPANGVQSICCGVKGSLPWAPRASTLLLEFSVASTSPEKDQAVGLRIFVSCDTQTCT